jgi:hypothetical protein
VKEGVLIGCDHHQEWLLSWWWENYTRHNRHPVAFVDFGMSSKAKDWCEKRGDLIVLECPKDFVLHKTLIDRDLISDWERGYGEVIWTSRENWFRKPFALLQTPFEKTLWVDLDCEVLGSVSPIFHKIHSHSGIAVSRERSLTIEEAGYNSGVIAYRKESPLLKLWAEACFHCNDKWLGDQDVLSFLIHREEIEIIELSDNYNWRMKFGVNLDAIIVHWVGSWGKEYIRRYLYHSH